MKHIPRILSVFGLTLLMSWANAQNTTTIPLNERVRTGKLDNGMTYYVMANQEPKERASLYFVQNVGAILEEDSQNGLAHFLEHMAFNGLEHYPGKKMLDYLESYGIKFGADINAYTGQDETVYMLKNIPVTNENLLDSALLVLHDWSGGLLLEAEEIEAERGVIREEWRTRRDARFRLRAQTRFHVFNNSQYAKRDIIGSLDVINNFEHKELKDYYKKWYRPDLQAVVVVGDLDAEKMEQKVKNLFSKIPARENADERIYYHIEGTEELGFVVAKDREARSVSIDWIFRWDVDRLKDEAYLRKRMAFGMMLTLINNRLKDFSSNPDCPATYMKAGNYNLARSKNAAYLRAIPKENKEKEAFIFLITELERIRRFGFTQSEFDRVKTSYQRWYEAYEKRYDKMGHDELAEELTDYFLSAEPFTSLKRSMEFANKTIPAISLKEIYGQLNVFQNENNSVITVEGPDSEEINYPAKEELLEEIAKIKASKLTAYEDDAIDGPLVTDELAEKKFVSEEALEGINGATLYKLENGAKVVVMPTELSNDEIMLSAFSFGGISLLPIDDLPSAGVVVNLAMVSGLGDYNASQLRKKLSGNTARVDMRISEDKEEITGSSSVQDFETMLQLVYQKFEHPRFEKAQFENMLAGMKQQLAFRKTDNQQAFYDTLSQVRTNYHPRTVLFNEEFIAHVDFDKTKAIYKDRFQDASDFTFVFVGNINKDKHLPLIKKYLGNLSSTNRAETWVNHDMKPAEGYTFRTVERGMDVEKATVSYAVYSDVKYNLKTRVYARTIASLLSKRYLATIREQEGGSYGVRVVPNIYKRPYEYASINVNFDCDPEKRQRLTKIMKDEMENMLKNGVNEDDLNEIKKSAIKNRKEDVNKNRFWLDAIKVSLENDEAITDIQSYNKLVQGMTAKSVQKFAEKLLKNPDSIIEVVLVPKK